jgi:ubiquinol-cytochrome c reductase cytochrome c1 subunit
MLPAAIRLMGRAGLFPLGQLSLAGNSQALQLSNSLRSQSSSAAAAATPAAAAAAAAGSGSGSDSSTLRAAAAFGGVLAGLGGAFAFSQASTDEGADGLGATHYPWSHSGWMDSFDHGSVRRGFTVYQQVCAACHSLYLVHWRDLVGHVLTEAEAKEMAAEYEYIDGPGDDGDRFARPGKLADYMPEPYRNEQHARYSNGGAYPPDLSYITGARHNGSNYVFALLLGYREPPAGIEIREGLHYNSYFPGQAIAMPQMIADDGVDYDDGTKAWASQQAKDVTTFLDWCLYPYQDDHKVAGMKAVILLVALFGFVGYSKRLIWAPLKTQRIVMDVVN